MHVADSSFIPLSSSCSLNSCLLIVWGFSRLPCYSYGLTVLEYLSLGALFVKVRGCSTSASSLFTMTIESAMLCYIWVSMCLMESCIRLSSSYPCIPLRTSPSTFMAWSTASVSFCCSPIMMEVSTTEMWSLLFWVFSPEPPGYNWLYEVSYWYEDTFGVIDLWRFGASDSSLGFRRFSQRETREASSMSMNTSSSRIWLEFMSRML